MALSYDDILCMTFGCARHKITEEGINFFRMSEGQSALFGAADRDVKNNLLHKNLSTAGVRLDL